MSDVVGVAGVEGEAALHPTLVGEWQGSGPVVNVLLGVGQEDQPSAVVAEEQTVIDQGLFVATDRRGVFVGQRQVREFPWEKLLAVQLGVLTRKSLVLYLPVTNRQKVSGIAGDWDTMLDVPTFVQLGVGLAQEGESRLLARLRDELADLYANEPPRSP